MRVHLLAATKCGVIILGMHQ